VRELQQRIQKQQQGAAKASNKASGSSSAEAGASGSSSSSSNRGRQSRAGDTVLTEREAERFMSAGGRAGLQQMAVMNAAASMAAATGRALSWMTGPDKRVHAFYDEYTKAKRCDPARVEHVCF
jgi:hypothetical protein